MGNHIEPGQLPDGVEASGTKLAAFARQNPKTFAYEELRVSLQEYKGRQFLRVSTWFIGRDSNKLYPAKGGATIRAGEIAAWMDALSEADRLINGGTQDAHQAEPAKMGQGRPQPAGR